MLTAVMLSVVMLSVVILSVVMLTAVMLSVVMLTVVAPSANLNTYWLFMDEFTLKIYQIPQRQTFNLFWGKMSRV